MNGGPNGGYDDGYRCCPCFWGTEPGSLVRRLPEFVDSFDGLYVLDAGCGEGKNAAALAQRGARVDAFDVSEYAVENGRRQWPELDSIRWRVADARNEELPPDHYDLVIAYGFTHCLADEAEIADLVSKLQATAKASALHVLVAFNDRRQELAAAHPGFHPTLLSHARYLDLYAGWEILVASDTDLTETHPHNQIEHTHSMTRLIARKRA